MSKRQQASIAILCLLCGVLGYWVGVIVTVQEVIDSFGPEVLQPVSDELAFPQWRKA